ncbi:MAG: hypothetical protein RLZZ395_1697 [Pseudomonadota bacterium]
MAWTVDWRPLSQRLQGWLPVTPVASPTRIFISSGW